ncbi:hypothetical protein OSJ57_21670 [Sphingomonas sp. HH69]
MSDDQSTIDNIRATLREIILEGLDRKPGGVHLTFLGSSFARQKKMPFEQYVNVLTVQGQIDIPQSARKMIPFIETYCTDIFEIDREIVGSETIKLKQSGKDGSSSEISPASVFTNHKFSKAIWAAFVRPLPAEYKRFISLDTLGFSDLKRKPSSGLWVEIKRNFITETPMDQPIDGPLVQARIGEWASENNIPIETLIDRSAAASFDRPSISDLMRIIAALPSDVAARWLIPADVFLNLEAPRRGG